MGVSRYRVESYYDAERLSIPESTVHPTVMTLANGLKLIVQPEGISDTISVAGHIRNNPDLEAPKGKEGLDQVLDQLLTYGTASLDRLAFQKALDDIAAANRYAAMTAQQVQAAFAKWIRPGDLVQITEGPNLK